MEAQEENKYLQLLKENLLSVALAFLGLIFLGYGLIVLTAKKDNSRDILFEAASTKAESSVAGASTKEIVVDVEGAVLKPGVYKLKADSRIQDALIASGGLSDEADREKVARTLNLASKLIDGGKLYIPLKGEEAPALGDTIVAQGGAININEASSSQLEDLPGIGPATAQKIIEGRPYAEIGDLVSKKAVSRTVFEKLKDKISVF